MILLVHILFGSAIATIIKNPYLAVILALFSHYFLDFFPHIEYPIDNITNKNFKKSLPQIISVATDLLSGIILIFIFSNNSPIIYISVFFALLPDGFSLLNVIFKNRLLDVHSKLHQEKLHFLKYKKIPNFWRFFTQILVVVISLFVLHQ